MIEILMATYNGGEYLKSQIDSIISQTVENWRLLIHDDGSSDQTVDIVKEYAKNDKRIIIIEDGIRFGNAGENFMHLISKASGDLIMFSDQDDVWNPDKIEKMKSLFENINHDVPTVGYSQAVAWDGNNELFTLWNRPSTLRNTLFSNCGIQGASSMFNKCMLDLMKKWKGCISMHDHLLLLLGLSCGKTLYYNKPLMRYRKHDNAVTIKYRTNRNWKNLWDGRRDFVLDTTHYKTMYAFAQIYNKYFNSEIEHILKAFFKLPNSNIRDRIISVLNNNFSIGNSRTALLCKILLRPFCSEEVKLITK